MNPFLRRFLPRGEKNVETQLENRTFTWIRPDSECGIHMACFLHVLDAYS